MINLTQKAHYPASAETERSSNEQVLNSRREKKGTHYKVAFEFIYLHDYLSSPVQN